MEDLKNKVEQLINSSKYDEAVKLVANKFDLQIKVEFLKNDYHFINDKNIRDIYKITLIKGGRRFSFNFGQSINNSGFYYTKGVRKITIDRKEINNKHLVSLIKTSDYDFLNNGKSDVIHYPKEPTMYDVLTCLQKYDVGSFEDFCSEFGYDDDSRKAKKTYKAVVKEYDKVCSLFNEQELEVLCLIN